MDDPTLSPLGNEEEENARPVVKTHRFALGRKPRKQRKSVSVEAPRLFNLPVRSSRVRLPFVPNLRRLGIFEMHVSEVIGSAFQATQAWDANVTTTASASVCSTLMLPQQQQQQTPRTPSGSETPMQTPPSISSLRRPCPLAMRPGSSLRMPITPTPDQQVTLTTVTGSDSTSSSSVYETPGASYRTPAPAAAAAASPGVSGRVFGARGSGYCCTCGHRFTEVDDDVCSYCAFGLDSLTQGSSTQSPAVPATV